MFKYVTLALLGVASASIAPREATELKAAAPVAPTEAQIKVGLDAAKKKWDAVTAAKTAYDKAVVLEASIKACKAHTAAAAALKKANEHKPKPVAADVKTATDNLAKAVLPKGVDAAKCKSDKTLAAAKLGAATTAVTTAKGKLGLSIAFVDPGTVAALKTMVEAGDVLFDQLLLTPHSALAAELTALAKQEKFYKAVAAACTAKQPNLKKAATLMETTTKTMHTAVTTQNGLAAAKQAAGLTALNTAAAAYQETCLKASAGIATALAAGVKDAAAKGKLLGYAKQYEAAKAATQKANAAAAGGGGLTWLWIVLGLAIAGAGGYFLYTKLKKED